MAIFVATSCLFFALFKFVRASENAKNARFYWVLLFRRSEQNTFESCHLDHKYGPFQTSWPLFGHLNT